VSAERQTEFERVMANYVRLQNAKTALEVALLNTMGMPTAHGYVKRALATVARQAGKAQARMRDLERQEEERHAAADDGAGPDDPAPRVEEGR
jgi:hypothetical protein